MCILLILTLPILLYVFGELLFACKRIHLFLEWIGFNMQPLLSDEERRLLGSRADLDRRQSQTRLLGALHERRAIDWRCEKLAQLDAQNDRTFSA